MSKHELENKSEIRIKVTDWLNKNKTDYQLLLWDFQDELKYNLDFKYKPHQFRCWVWDKVIKKLEKRHGF